MGDVLRTWSWSTISDLQGTFLNTGPGDGFHAQAWSRRVDTRLVSLEHDRQRHERQPPFPARLALRYRRFIGIWLLANAIPMSLIMSRDDHLSLGPVIFGSHIYMGLFVLFGLPRIAKYSRS